MARQKNSGENRMDVYSYEVAQKVKRANKYRGKRRDKRDQVKRIRVYDDTPRKKMRYTPDEEDMDLT